MRSWLSGRVSSRAAWTGVGAVLVIAGLATGLPWLRRDQKVRADDAQSRGRVSVGAEPSAAGEPAVKLDGERQVAIGLKTARVGSSKTYHALTAPGRITPDETRFAYITPRAAGVVRSVSARVGQEVKVGDLLATIDSQSVAQARLDLLTSTQELEIARTQARRQEMTGQAILELVERLKAGDSPQKIHERFEGRPIGENRERLITAYAQHRLNELTRQRVQALHDKGALPIKDLEKVNAEHETSMATYQALMDQMGYEASLAGSRAQQAVRQAETAVQVAQERLRVLGVRTDGTEPKVASGKVEGVGADGTLPGLDGHAGAPKPDAILPRPGSDSTSVEPPGAEVGHGEATSLGRPISNYCLWAPFSGTILDREMLVPGVAVDATEKIFTLADLSRVWVEVNVHESDFGRLAGVRGARIRFTSPAYPDRTFEGEVIYQGDLVDEKSRSVHLLAKADNADRALKPGMYVDVEVLAPSDEPVPVVPRSALLSDGEAQFVYVRTGPEQFERRDVTLGARTGDDVVVRRGLTAGQEVVVEGGFKLKTIAERGDAPAG